MEQSNLQHTTQVAPKSGFNWADFFSFKTMITLKIIQIVYAVVAIIITIGALVMMFKSNESRYGYSTGPNPTLMGLLLLIFGNVAWRIWCELMIVIFRINRTLTNINENVQAK